MKKNLKQRILTGIVFLAVSIGSVFVHPLCYMAVFLVFTIVGLKEFYNICRANKKNPQVVFGLIIGIVSFVLLSLTALGYIANPKLLLIILLLISVVPIVELYRKTDTHLSNWAYTVFGILYVAIPFGLMSFFLINPIKQEYSPAIFLSFFALIWISDTGAYCAGVLFGKHKLMPSISPKKTIEGLVGGIIFTLLASWAISQIVGIYSIMEWLIIAVVVVFFATFGDLAESMIKRNVGIKDSGNLLPGHGGVLDRFDSAILASPVVFCLLTILNN